MKFNDTVYILSARIADATQGEAQAVVYPRSFELIEGRIIEPSDEYGWVCVDVNGIQNDYHRDILLNKREAEIFIKNISGSYHLPKYNFEEKVKIKNPKKTSSGVVSKYDGGDL